MAKLTIQQFGATIKQKYPQYANFSDYEIGQKTIQKYPQYNEKVHFSFDVPDIKTQETQQQKIARLQAEGAQATTEAKKANSVFGKAANFGKALVTNLMPSEVGLGKSIAAIDGNARDNYSKSLVQTQGLQADLLKKIRESEQAGKDTTKLKQVYNSNISQINRLQDLLGETSANLPSTGKVLGQIGGTLLDILTAGTYGKAKTVGMEAFKLAPSSSLATKAATSVGLPELGKIAEQKASGLFTKAGATNVLKGAGIGYANDVTMGAQGLRGEDRTGGKAFIPGLGTAIGGAIPLVSELNQSYKNRYNPTKEQIGKAVDDLESKYIEWSSGTKPGKKLINKLNNKTEALNNAGTSGNTPMRTLAENGVVPEIKGTKFNTFDQAVEYRNGVSPLQDVNRAALQEAGLSTVPTSLDELQRKAIEFARSKENINSGRANKMVKEIVSEFNILRNEYPDGNIPLGLQDEIKSARWKNVFGNKGLIDADVLKKDSEYAIAKAFQKNIEEVAAKAGFTDVAQLNREIGDRLEASRFLEGLDGKVLKGGRVSKYVGTLIGSSMANSIPGKIVGAIGGNAVADYLVKSSVQNPIRRSILMKLAQDDPEAYQMAVKWLAEQDALRATRLALPEPRYIPAGGKLKEGYNVDAAGNKTLIQGESAAVLPAQKNLVTNNPNTGKFQTSYNSYSKSPAAQQTIPAITNVKKNGIPNTIPQSGNKINDTINTLKTSGRDLDRAIESGAISLDKVYKDTTGHLQPERAKQAISDLALKLNMFSKGLGDKFKSIVNTSNPTPTNLENQAIELLKNNKGNIKADVLAKVAAGTAVGLGVFNKLKNSSNTTIYKAPEDKTQFPKNKTLTKNQTSNALLALESSHGKDKGSADPGELKWLTGLTPIAIKELKRLGIKDNVDINNKEDVIDASVKYFQLLQKRNPNMTPAEVYVYKYWGGGKTEKQKKDKMIKFNELISKYNE